MEKRFIIAIVLVFLVLFAWPFIFGIRRQSPTTRPQEKVEEAQKQEPVEEKIPEPELEVFPEVSEETIIPVQTPLYEVQLTTEGARAVSWKLKEYSQRIKNPEGELDYVDLIPSGLTRHTAMNWLRLKFPDPQIQDELEDAQWEPDKGSLNVDDVEGAQDSIEFVYRTSTGTVISKRMTFFRDNYFVDVDVSFHNTLTEEAKLGGYSLCWGAGIAKDEIIKDMEVAGEGPVVLLRTEKGLQLNKKWQRTGFACFGGKYIQNPEQDGPVSWIGFASKYFAAVLIPGPEPWWSDIGKPGKRYAVSTDVKDTVLPPALTAGQVWSEWGRSTTVALVWPEFSIPADGKVTHQFRVYVGPKKWDILRGIKGRDSSTESLGLGKMINFGRFGILGKATLWLLEVFYRVSNNYGVAIIFMTILIKLLYLPLTQKSFKSMRKMQELAPKLAALKERHRDDPQRVQKETMKLYKQQGVNPMGGCLPLLFQMPVFWALFTTLRGAVELRGAMFIQGWVTDLSLPDTVAAVAGFPIRVLPILMTGSMLAQQFLFGTRGQAQSSKMMAFMPLIFAFIFYGMPSGLVLYWLCNNILAIGHQYMIGRQRDKQTGVQGEETVKKSRSNRKEKQNLNP
jgi:YidC/Oxa1 family membrane protein insertase